MRKKFELNVESVAKQKYKVPPSLFIETHKWALHLLYKCSSGFFFWLALLFSKLSVVLAAPAEKVLKTLWEKEKMLVTSSQPPTMFSIPSRTDSATSAASMSSSTNILNFDNSEI